MYLEIIVIIIIIHHLTPPPPPPHQILMSHIKNLKRTPNKAKQNDNILPKTLSDFSRLFRLSEEETQRFIEEVGGLEVTEEGRVVVGEVQGGKQGEDRVEQLCFDSDIEFLRQKIPFFSGDSTSFSFLPFSHLVLGTYEDYRAWGEGSVGGEGRGGLGGEALEREKEERVKREKERLKKEMERLEREKEMREKEEIRRQKEREIERERQQRELQRQKEEREKEREKERERQRELQRQKQERQKEMERERERERERQRQEREKEKERQRQRQKMEMEKEKERQRQREEMERERERERERQRQKEIEMKERERQREREREKQREEERRRQIEKERQRREQEEREKEEQRKREEEEQRLKEKTNFLLASPPPLSSLVEGGRKGRVKGAITLGPWREGGERKRERGEGEEKGKAVGWKEIKRRKEEKRGEGRGKEVGKKARALKERRGEELGEVVDRHVETFLLSKFWGGEEERRKGGRKGKGGVREGGAALFWYLVEMYNRLLKELTDNIEADLEKIASSSSLVSLVKGILEGLKLPLAYDVHSPPQLLPYLKMLSPSSSFPSPNSSRPPIMPSTPPSSSSSSHSIPPSPLPSSSLSSLPYPYSPSSRHLPLPSTPTPPPSAILSLEKSVKETLERFYGLDHFATITTTNNNNNNNNTNNIDDCFPWLTVFKLLFVWKLEGVPVGCLLDFSSLKRFLSFYFNIISFFSLPHPLPPRKHPLLYNLKIEIKSHLPLISPLPSSSSSSSSSSLPKSMSTGSLKRRSREEEGENFRGGGKERNPHHQSPFVKRRKILEMREGRKVREREREEERERERERERDFDSADVLAAKVKLNVEATTSFIRELEEIISPSGSSSSFTIPSSSSSFSTRSSSSSFVTPSSSSFTTPSSSSSARQLFTTPSSSSLSNPSPSSSFTSPSSSSSSFLSPPLQNRIDDMEQKQKEFSKYLADLGLL